MGRCQIFKIDTNSLRHLASPTSFKIELDSTISYEKKPCLHWRRHGDKAACLAAVC